MLHSSVPSFGGIILHEFIFEEMPGGLLAVEFRQGNLVRIAFHSSRELGKGGVREGGVVVSDGACAGAGMLGLGCKPLSR